MRSHGAERRCSFALHVIKAKTAHIEGAKNPWSHINKQSDSREKQMVCPPRSNYETPYPHPYLTYISTEPTVELGRHSGRRPPSRARVFTDQGAGA